MIDKVKLYPAYAWTCPKCGTDHFEPAVTQELTTEERERLADINDVDPEEMGGELVAMPEGVTCWECELDFDVDFDDQNVIEGVEPAFPEPDDDEDDD